MTPIEETRNKLLQWYYNDLNNLDEVMALLTLFAQVKPILRPIEDIQLAIIESIRNLR